VESKEKLDLLILPAKMYVCMYVVLFATATITFLNMLMIILPRIKLYGEPRIANLPKKLTFK